MNYPLKYEQKNGSLYSLYSLNQNISPPKQRINQEKFENFQKSQDSIIQSKNLFKKKENLNENSQFDSKTNELTFGSRLFDQSKNQSNLFMRTSNEFLLKEEKDREFYRTFCDTTKNEENKDDLLLRRVKSGGPDTKKTNFNSSNFFHDGNNQNKHIQTNTELLLKNSFNEIKTRIENKDNYYVSDLIKDFNRNKVMDKYRSLNYEESKNFNYLSERNTDKYENSNIYSHFSPKLESISNRVDNFIKENSRNSVSKTFYEINEKSKNLEKKKQKTINTKKKPKENIEKNENLKSETQKLKIKISNLEKENNILKNELEFLKKTQLEEINNVKKELSEIYSSKKYLLDLCAQLKLENDKLNKELTNKININNINNTNFYKISDSISWLEDTTQLLLKNLSVNSMKEIIPKIKEMNKKISSFKKFEDSIIEMYKKCNFSNGENNVNSENNLKNAWKWMKKLIVEYVVLKKKIEDDNINQEIIDLIGKKYITKDKFEIKKKIKEEIFDNIYRKDLIHT